MHKKSPAVIKARKISGQRECTPEDIRQACGQRTGPGQADYGGTAKAEKKDAEEQMRQEKMSRYERSFFGSGPLPEDSARKRAVRRKVSQFIFHFAQ